MDAQLANDDTSEYVRLIFTQYRKETAATKPEAERCAHPHRGCSRRRLFEGGTMGRLLSMRDNNCTFVHDSMH